MSHRSWCFTLNNYTDDDLTRLKDYFLPVTNVLYVSFEVSETLTPHLQGYFTLKRPARLPKLKKLLSDRYHFEKANGDHNDNQLYVFKDGSTPFINHNNGGAGKRNDITDWIDLREEHGLKKAVQIDPATFVKFHKGLDRAWSVLKGPEPRTDYPKCVWLYGATGIGKSYWAWQEYSGSVFFLHHYPWFDGYFNQDCVVIDEYDKRDYKPEILLTLMDRFPMPVQVKFGMQEFNPKCIVVTSSVAPENLFHGTDWDQVKRRLSIIATRPDKDSEWFYELNE